MRKTNSPETLWFPGRCLTSPGPRRAKGRTPAWEAVVIALRAIKVDENAPDAERDRRPPSRDREVRGTAPSGLSGDPARQAGSSHVVFDGALRAAIGTHCPPALPKMYAAKWPVTSAYSAGDTAMYPAQLARRKHRALYRKE
jgi:hypothetical protein